MKHMLNLLLAAMLFGSVVSFGQSTRNRRVLIVVTSHDKLGSTGEKTGIWIEEFATPYYALKDQGVSVTVVSPKGGAAPIDPKSNLKDYATESTRRFYKDATAQNLLANTGKISDVNIADFDAVFYPGGHGPMWDLAEDKGSAKLIEQFYSENKPVALVCHGPAALKNTRSKSGDALFKGRKVTGFTNTEESAVKLTDVVPFSLENMLKEKGGVYVKGEDWKPFVIKDGLLITGQNPASAHGVADELLKVLNVNN